MAVYFEGTSTKNRYEVGQAYTNSRGGISVAQPDGTFRDLGSGQVSRGSYGNPDVNWYASGSDSVARPAFYTDQGRAVYTRDAHSPTNVVGGAQSAGALIAPGAGFGSDGSVPITRQATHGNRGAFIRDWAFSGKSEPVQDAIFGGFHWVANPKFDNGEWTEVRYGDSELISTAVGIGIFGADIGFNAARLVWGDNVQNMSPKDRWDNLVERAAVAAPDLGNSMMEIGFGAVAGARNWAAKNAMVEEAMDRGRASVNDAWDYREQLQAEEAAKVAPRNVDKWLGDFAVGF